MDVRRLQPAEWEAFREIRLRALADAPEAFGATHADEVALSDAGWQERTSRPDRAVFVVDGPDALIGLAQGGPAPGIPDAAAVYSMWVAPEARRLGLGSALIEAVKAWAVEAGYPGLGLGVTTTNSPAIAFYERLGFVDNGDRYPLREGTGLTIQIMVMPIL
jgi:ribosomal protein S18 acetylase RimI-like enzyme